MAIYFRGGEMVQKGRGIGGFFRGLINVLRPLFRSTGRSVVTAATKAASSKTVKNIAKTLGKQALDSTANITKDLINGNDLNNSIQRERANFKHTGTKVVDKLNSRLQKKMNKMSDNKVTKRKLTTKNAPNKRRKIAIKKRTDDILLKKYK